MPHRDIYSHAFMVCKFGVELFIFKSIGVYIFLYDHSSFRHTEHVLINAKAFTRGGGAAVAALQGPTGAVRVAVGRTLAVRPHAQVGVGLGEGSSRGLGHGHGAAG